MNKLESLPTTRTIEAVRKSKEALDLFTTGA
ncbi:DUF2560 family protein [Escherichia coli]|nr:DUF2560 family protein [Escherichia coli]MCZ6315463.1 DUF2560 family protein [Escherichia coli]